VLVHTAGAVTMDVLQPYATHTGIIWPIYSIVKDSLPKHREIPIAMRSNTEHAGVVVQKLTSSISDIYYTVSFEQRQWLHLCAVLINNFTNHLMAISETICHEQRIPFSLLYPIVKQTAERITHTSPTKLQTGPAKRNDTNTINKQLDMLAETPEWQELYKAATTSINKMYRNDKGE
jgi:predicted short-subunit dehydrogenase-like oxidoreductase (DUF2520 family)